MHTLDYFAEQISNHAQYGPPPKGQTGVVRNTLSEHFPRLTKEILRGTVIEFSQNAQAALAKELIELRKQIPAGYRDLVDATAARINEHLQLIYK